jgi:hypothetical protein
MADQNIPGWGDLFALLGNNNPVAVMSKSAEQFRTAVTGFIEAVSTFKQTMENLNATTARMNRLLDEIEGPLHILMPQMTAATEQASKVFTMLTGPVERVAPGLAQLAETLNSPVMLELPKRMGEAMDAMAGLPKTLGPLGQMAEVAGGLFGRGLSPFGGARTSGAPTARRVETAPASSAEPEHAASHRSAANTSAAKGATAKKATTKKSAGKKPAHRKSAAKKAAGRDGKHHAGETDG